MENVIKRLTHEEQKCLPSENGDGAALTARGKGRFDLARSLDIKIIQRYCHLISGSNESNECDPFRLR